MSVAIKLKMAAVVEEQHFKGRTEFTVTVVTVNCWIIGKTSDSLGIVVSTSVKAALSFSLNSLFGSQKHRNLHDYALADHATNSASTKFTDESNSAA